MDKSKSNLIAGLDEVGMGCLAGPLVICVAAFDTSQKHWDGIKDSKMMRSEAREDMIHAILSKAQYLNFGYATVDQINRLGIPDAWQLAAEMALSGAPTFMRLTIDGLRTVRSYRGAQQAVPKADRDHWQVSAASIAAKVIRDRHMVALSEHYPEYCWAKNMGYGTKDHIEALRTIGPSPLHRKGFIKNFVNP